MLDAQGRCCGRKPWEYPRRPAYRFCLRCDRAYGLRTDEQIPNWAWQMVDGAWKQTRTIIRDNPSEDD